MDDFPSNSHRVSPERKDVNNQEREIETVITGKVVRRKKTLGRRFMDAFFSRDSNSVFGYLVKDVLVPALQATATDMVTQGIHKAVYGTTQSSNRTSRPIGNRNHIGYDRFGPSRLTTSISSSSTSITPASRRSSSRPSPYNSSEIILETRDEADRVAEKLYEILQEYGVATVGDLNSLIGQTSEYTDHKWGWDNLRVDIRRIREGYLLILPEPEDLR